MYPSPKNCSKAEINTLSHKPTQELSTDKVKKRRAFLKEQLSVKDMIIDQDQQEKVIDLLMRYFDAMSTNSKVHSIYYSSI